MGGQVFGERGGSGQVWDASAGAFTRVPSGAAEARVRGWAGGAAHGGDGGGCAAAG